MFHVNINVVSHKVDRRLSCISKLTHNGSDMCGAKVVQYCGLQWLCKLYIIPLEITVGGGVAMMQSETIIFPK